MKPFNLEQALAGAPVMFRNGYAVDELFYSTTLKKRPIFTISNSFIRQHNKDGTYYAEPSESEYDLFMAPVKREGWLVKHKDNSLIVSVCIFSTEEVARESVEGDQYEYIKVEWYE